jgi:endonuclease-3
MTASSSNRAADRKRVRRALERLRSAYGKPVLRPHRSPLDELILTILSQNTSDRNRDVAYLRLKERFPTWQSVSDASPDAIEAAIRPGGISQVKARRILDILHTLEGNDLTWLETAPLSSARNYLCSLPGVGRKTAACVLLFSYGRADVPVDTHVYRVGTRLGFFAPSSSFEEAHDRLLELASPQEAYELHVSLIRHGRRTCTARAPRCESCVLLRMCPFGRASLGKASQADKAG